MNPEPNVSGAKKILVVDDNFIIQRTVSRALKEKGYQVLTATEISAALGVVRREKPDLILLDLTFPPDSANIGGATQDGFFVMDWLRHTPEAKNIPFIIISGTDPSKYQGQLADSGIVAYFHKPLNHGELLAAIHTALNGAAPDKPPGPT